MRHLANVRGDQSLVKPLVKYGDFSERELRFTFAICCRPCVCRLSIGGSNFPQYFYGVRYLCHNLTSIENFTEIVSGEPLRLGSETLEG